MRSDTTTAEAMRLLGTILTRLSQPTVAVMIFQVMILAFMVPNSRLIGADTDIVYSYSILYVLMMVLAFYRKTPLDRLGWSGDGLGSWGKKLPRGLMWAFLYGLLAFTITVAYAVWRYQPEAANLPAGVGMNMLFQQLFLVTLTETMVFQGLFPLILDYELEKNRQKDEEARAVKVGLKQHSIARLVCVIIISQGFFGLSHYFVYGGSWASILWAAMFGTVWYLALRQFGLIAAWWSHLGINLVALGLIAVRVTVMMIGG